MELRSPTYHKRGPSCFLIIIVFLLMGIAFYLFNNRNEIKAAIVPAPTLTPTQSPANLVLRAQLYVRDGEFDNAIASYEDVIKIAPDRIDNYIRLIDLLVQVGNPERALELADQALAIDEGNDQLYTVKAASHLRNGDRLAENSENPDTEYARAVEAARAATRLNSQNARAHAYIAAGLVREDISLVNQALVSAQEALDITERDAREDPTRKLDKVVLYHYAEVQSAAGYYDIAQERLSQAFDIDKNYLDARMELARIYFFYRKNNAGAIDLLETATENNPNNADLFDTLAYFEIVAGYYDKAEEYARRAVNANPDMVRAHAHLGWAYFKNSNYPLAIDALKAATEQYGEPNADTAFYFALLGLATYFEDAADCTEAIPILQSALAVSAPNSPAEINAQVGLDDCRDFELNQP
ncbi:MAG TPA: tetratricopeptide repeat protein [Anaerolineae bacterium]|nr:tetratricopeptide repeat protein [Anaerolineae bacterium]